MDNQNILGVGSSASIAEIKQAFRDAAKEFHPDRNHSPEAAIAFARIKDAYDALIQERMAKGETVGVTATFNGTTATAMTAHYQPQKHPIHKDSTAHIQALDEMARKSPKRAVFGKSKEPDEVKKHRKKLKTNERRLRGLY